MRVANDKFYTKKEVVFDCLKTLDVDNYDLVIEPSAGDGAFSGELDCLAMDIAPEKDYIEKFDFFDYKGDKSKKILVIGNPPFGKNGSLAIKFFNHAAEFASTIAFILPKSFKKSSMQNRLDKRFHLEFEMDVPKKAFEVNRKEYDVPCVWQIWKLGECRIKEDKIEIDDFKFCSKDKANIAIRRVGYYAGKAYLDLDLYSKNSMYYIETSNIEKILDKLNKCIYNYDNTVGPRSISQQDIIKAYIGV